MSHRKLSPQALRLKGLHIFATLLLMVMVSMSTHAKAHQPHEHACKKEYQAASIAISAQAKRHGTRHLLQARLNHAWRALWDGQKLAVGNQHLNALDELLTGHASHGIAAQGKALISQAVAEFRQCINGGPPVTTATLTVSVFNPDFDRPDAKGSAADDNVYLFVDGSFMTRTDASGQATLIVPQGSVTIQAIVPSFAIATATVETRKGMTVPVQMILDDGKEVSTPVQLAVSGMVGDVLPFTFDSFAITLFDNGAVRPATEVGRISIEDVLGNTLVKLSDDFQVDAQGRLVPKNLDVVSQAVAKYPGKALVLNVSAEDAQGFTLKGTQAVYWGQYPLNVALVAPPSNPALQVAGVEVVYQLMGTDLTLRGTSDASGHVSFGVVPMGNAILDSQVMQSGRHYYGQAMFFLSRPSQARVTMVHIDDVVNDVPRFELLPISRTAASSLIPSSEFSAEAQAQRENMHMQRRAASGVKPRVGGAGRSSEETIRLTVIADGADQPVSASQTLSVPKGTKRVTLQYEVGTDEYPFYVKKQSIYNDTWSLSVAASQSGKILFHIARNVNSQLNTAPVWLDGGFTEIVEKSIDVSALTKDGPANLTMTATTTNIADGLLPTMVFAILKEGEDQLIINEVMSDEVIPTRGDHRSYSVPLQGENNRLSRWFTLQVEKPENSQITRVRAELQNDSDTTVAGGQLFEEGAGANVQIVNSTTLRVRVTSHAGGTVSSVPPPTHAITYKFTVFANLEDGTEVSGEASSTPKRALWRMQAEWRDPARRYGFRDPGHDDWLSLSTWEYINRHGALLTRIDDISGEHGSDIGHASHRAGTDIDLMHVYAFGANSGGDGYNRLRNALIRVMSQPAAETVNDRAALVAWATQTRERFAEILTTTDAQMIFYASGSAHAASNISLRSGWARRLLVDGTVTAVGGQVFDTGLGVWGFPQGRLDYNSEHNSHFHLKRPSDL